MTDGPNGGNGDGGGDGGGGGGEDPPERSTLVDEPEAPELTYEPAAAPPPAASEDDLREAVGVPRREKARAPSEDDRDRDRDLADPTPLSPEQQARRRKLFLTLGLSLIASLVIIAFVFLGRANSNRLVFACSADQITAEEGRGFPPWGTRELDGPAWAPIAIPPQAECQTRETDDANELEGWYLDALIDQAAAKLSAREVTAVDDAEKQLQQALLLARPQDRRDERHRVERLLGDVVYWRAAAKVKAATDALAEAGKLYAQAAASRPVHVTDAAAWADYAKHLAEQLQLGPESLRAAPPLAAPLPDVRVPAPPGVALPVESPDAATGAPLTPVDAGVPSGGVLL
jgi:hypothetical protein